MRKEYLLIGASAAIAVAGSARAAPTVSMINGSLFNLDGTLATLSPENPNGTYDIVAAEGNTASGNFLIGDPADTTDNVVNFDGVQEATQAHLLGGVVPLVNESFVINADGSQTISFTMVSAQGGDLFVGGFADGLGNPLDKAVFFIGGLGDVVDSTPAFGSVISAQLDMLNASGSVFGGPVAITFLTSPWDGFLGVAVTGGVGIGIHTVTFSVTVNKIPTPGAFALFGIAGLAATRRRR